MTKHPKVSAHVGDMEDHLQRPNANGAIGGVLGGPFEPSAVSLSDEDREVSGESISLPERGRLLCFGVVELGSELSWRELHAPSEAQPGVRKGQPTLTYPVGNDMKTLGALSRGGGRNRTDVRGFAGPCLNHSATPP